MYCCINSSDIPRFHGSSQLIPDTIKPAIIYLYYRRLDNARKQGSCNDGYILRFPFSRLPDVWGDGKKRIDFWVPAGFGKGFTRRKR
jgi:hypothetical protein